MWAMWGNVSKLEVVLHEDGRTRKIVNQDCGIFFQNLYIILAWPQEMFNYDMDDNMNQTRLGHRNQLWSKT